jgi:hypothetical protein
VSDQEKKPNEDDVEAHSSNPDSTDISDKDVEGHLLNTTDPSSTNPDEPDVEGHMADPSMTDPSMTDPS